MGQGGFRLQRHLWFESSESGAELRPNVFPFNSFSRLMTVRCLILAAGAFVWALAGAGCSDRERGPVPAETEDPYYVQGKQLQKQGRNAEALNAFLKVIDRRGENPSPESHLEAGLICLYQTKDFPAAYYHLRRYYRAQPNSKEAPLVLGKIEEAKREFARTLPGRPMEDQSVRMAMDEEVGKLRRENDELRAEIAVLRGGGAIPVQRTPRLIALPPEMLTTAPARPPPVAAVIDPAQASVSPQPEFEPAPVVQRISPPVSPSPRPGGVPPAPKSAAKAGRTHTVAPKETLYGISRRYNVTVEAIVSANPATLPRATAPLKVGSVLRIP